MQDKAQLGNRYTCYQCGCKFYDLNRPIPTCPECSADQREAPLRDIKALLKSGKRRPAREDDELVEDDLALDDEEGEEEDDDEGLGLLGDDEDEEPADEEDMD